MWRSHFVVLGEEPTKSRLERLKDGYQLWREGTTGLFYLTAHSKPLGSRPDFSQFLDRQIAHKIDVSALEAFMSDKDSAVDPNKHEVSIDLIQQTATLAKQLGLSVLAAEDTDDEYGMAVMADNRAIQYLRFKTMLNDAPDLEGGVEVVYTPEAGFVIDHEPAPVAYSVAHKAIAEVYGQAGLNLYDYSSPKPTREQAKQLTAKRDISIKAYLDGYGVFKRLNHAPPQLTRLERVIVPFRFVGSAIILPFLLTGLIVATMIGAVKDGRDWDPGEWTIILLGVAVLAPPILLAVWLARALLG